MDEVDGHWIYMNFTSMKTQEYRINSKEHVHCCIFWSRIHPQGWRIFTKFARGVFSLRADCALLVQELLVPCLREKLQAVARHSCIAMLVKLVGVLMRGIFLEIKTRFFLSMMVFK